MVKLGHLGKRVAPPLRTNSARDITTRLFSAAVAPESTVSKTTKNAEFRISRWSPEGSARRTMQSFTVATAECGPMVLDALIKIKAESDPVLMYFELFLGLLIKNKKN